MIDWQMYLLDEMQILTYNVAVNTTWAQFMPRDPLRFSFLFPWGSGANLNIWFGQSAPSGNPFRQSTGSGWAFLRKPDLGSLICEPIWLQYGSGSANFSFQVVSYSPERWRVYNEWVRANVPEFGS